MLTEKHIDPLEAAIVFEKAAYREPLLEALRAAGVSVVAEFRISELDEKTLQGIDAKVMIVNLEPILNGKADLLNALVSGQFKGAIVFNDAEAMTHLEGADKARWARHMAAKVNGGNGLPPPPEFLSRDEPAPLRPSGVELWVLAASIGGPEALRGFLSALRPDIPYAFVLAQHIGSEFLDLMVAQLSQVSRLAVRIAEDGDRLQAGVVLVTPVDARFALDDQHRVMLSEQQEASPFSPCIDQVMRNCAAAFGAPVNAMIFSGMASDGIAGATQLMERGGEVWVQDPETCVVSSIVDGALKTGQVSFIGSPGELAEHMNQRAHTGAAATA